MAEVRIPVLDTWTRDANAALQLRCPRASAAQRRSGLKGKSEPRLCGSPQPRGVVRLASEDAAFRVRGRSQKLPQLPLCTPSPRVAQGIQRAPPYASVSPQDRRCQAESPPRAAAPSVHTSCSTHLQQEKPAAAPLSLQGPRGLRLGQRHPAPAGREGWAAPLLCRPVGCTAVRRCTLQAAWLRLTLSS